MVAARPGQPATGRAPEPVPGARVLIAGYYGFGNAGDEAILAAMVADFRALRPRLALSVLSADPEWTSATHRVHAVRFTDLGAVMDEVRRADLVILGGGGLFHDYWGVDASTVLSAQHAGIPYYCSIALRAALADRPFMLYAVGVGPLLTDEGRWLTGYAFEQALVATVRDQASLEDLAAAGIDTTNVRVTADPAYTLPPAGLDTVRPILDALPAPRLSVALRNWDVGVRPAEWEAAVAGALERFLDASGGSVLFVPFQAIPGELEDDAAVAARVRGRLRDPSRTAVVDARLPVAEKAALIAGCELMLGMRLHSLVFAACGGVPAAAIVYDPKVRGFAEAAGLGDYATDVGSLTAVGLADRLQSLLRNADVLGPALRAHGEEMARRARENTSLAVDLLEGRGHGPIRAPERLVPMLKSAVQALTAAQENLQAQLGAQRDELASREELILYFRNAVRLKDEDIAWLRAEVRRRDQRLREAVAGLQQEVALREGWLQALYRTRAWKVCRRYWRLRRAAWRLVHPAEPAAPTAFPAPLPPSEAPAFAPGPPLPRPLPARHDVVCFSIIDWDFRWQRPQQILSRFAQEGHRVFFISITRFLAPNEGPYEARPLRDNVWEVRLATPSPIDVYCGELAGGVAEALVEGLRALRDDFHVTCAVSMVQVATWAPAARLARERFGWRIAYDCMDEWESFPGMKPGVLEAEKRLVREADLLLVSAQKLRDKWAGQNANTLLVRNAADFDHFRSPPALDPLPGLEGRVVGYFGAIAAWLDLELVERLARERPRCTFVLVGGLFDVDVSRLRSLPNVRLLGQQPYEHMPAYLRRFDACLIPFRVNAITAATDPVKFYEYMSQGKPVVATSMPELEPYRDYLYIADDHGDFIRKVDAALAENDAGLREQRVRLAAENTWHARLEAIAGGIRAAHPKASIVVVADADRDRTRRCLESVLANTPYPHYELIVVDDTSGGAAPEWLLERQSRDPRVRVILNPTSRGLAAARSQGLAAATGERLVLLDSHAVVPNGWLSRLLRHLERPEVGLVASVTNLPQGASCIPVPYRGLERLEEFAARNAREHDGQALDIEVAPLHCVALRQDVWAQVGLVDGGTAVSLFEDSDLSNRVRQAGYRITCARDTYVHCGDGNSSL